MQMEMKAEVAIFVSDELDFKTKTVTKYKEVFSCLRIKSFNYSSPLFMLLFLFLNFCVLHWLLSPDQCCVEVVRVDILAFFLILGRVIFFNLPYFSH